MTKWVSWNTNMKKKCKNSQLKIPRWAASESITQKEKFLSLRLRCDYSNSPTLSNVGELIDPISIIMHAMGELFFSSQPTATTCLVWSWCVKGCLCICLGRKRQGVWSQVRLWWLCHTDEPQEERNSCPWLPLPGWYVCVHAYSIGLTTELVRVLQCFLCIELIRSIQCNYPSTVRERKVLHLFALSTKQ